MKKIIFAAVVLAIVVSAYAFSVPKPSIIGVEAAVTGRSVGDLIGDWMGAPK